MIPKTIVIFAVLAMGPTLKVNKMKIFETTFQGTSDDQNTYQLALNQDTVVYVCRNFKGDQNKQDIVPSGWYLDQIFKASLLWIDGEQDWKVYPTREAWAEVEAYLASK